MRNGYELTEYEITEEMIQAIREDRGNQQIIHNRLNDLCWSSLLHITSGTMSWNNNPVDFNVEGSLNLPYFMERMGYHKRYRSLYDAIKNRRIDSWIHEIHVGKVDTYENRFLNMCRVDLLQDIRPVRWLIDERKFGKLWGQIEALDIWIMGYVDDLRSEAGRIITEFDTDFKVKLHILNNTEDRVYLKDVIGIWKTT